MLRASFVFLVCLILFSVQAASAADAAASPGGVLVGALPDGTAVYLQPLDAPGNPYLGQYSAYDEWVYANRRVVPQNEIDEYYQSRRGGTKNEGSQLVSAQVDAAGYLVPESLAASQREEDWEGPTVESLIASFPGTYKPLDPVRTVQIYASGELPAEAGQARQQAWDDAGAQRYPPIPAWLGEHPPLKTLFVPNGDILTFGTLGLKAEGNPNYPPDFEPEGFLWYRYTAEGRLLGTYDLGTAPWGDNWVSIYWPQRETVCNQFKDAKGFNNLRSGLGYSLIPEYADATKLDEFGQVAASGLRAAFDYDGSPVDGKQVLDPQRNGQGVMIGAKMLASAYASQLRRGVTSASSSSPYAGTQDGPVMAGAEVLPYRVIGTTGMRRFVNAEEILVTDGKPKTWVEVRPLDDPANPYKDEYGPWDQWVLGQVGAQDEQITALMNKNWKLRQEITNKAKKEGRALTADENEQMSKLDGVRKEDQGDWEVYNCDVTPEGWLLPLAWSYERRAGRDKLRDIRGDKADALQIHRLAPFEFQATGRMPAELRADFAAASKREKTPLPALPQWLLDAPVERACFMPSGEIVTYGKPGSYRTEPEVPYKERSAGVDKNLYRFNAAGEQIVSLPAKENIPACLFDPAMAQRYAEAKLLHYDIYISGGVLLFRDQSSQELLAAYDWDGSVLDISQPIMRVPAEGPHWYYWGEIAEAARERGQLPLLPEASAVQLASN